MKLKLFITTLFVVGAAAMSLGAQAATEVEKSPASASEIKAPAMEMATEKAAIQKRHSHVEEKTGVPQAMPIAPSSEYNPAKDPNRHLHPRDGK